MALACASSKRRAFASLAENSSCRVLRLPSSSPGSSIAETEGPIPDPDPDHDHDTSMWIIALLLRLVPLLLCVAFLTLAERGVLGSMQRRAGPEVSGVWGLLQPFWDGLKLGLAEPILPSSASGLFLWAPVLSFVISQMIWAIIPMGTGFGVIDGVSSGLAVAGLSSVAVYGVLLAGWASNSKYAFLGGCRSAAGMVSYELPMGAVFVTLAALTRDITGMHSLAFSSFGVVNEVVWLALPLWPMVIAWFVLTLAEAKRAPFDLPEAEAELVAGYNVEYSSMGFALFFLAEYASMAAMAAVTALAFMHGTGAGLGLPLAAKTVILFYPFIWVRNTLPRYRPDQFMRLGWKVFLPITLAFMVAHHTLFLSFDLA
jgi:NADH:ubiquinone oxidoreductase subunit H